MKHRLSLYCLSSLIATVLASVPEVHAQNGTWNNAYTGNQSWNTANRWMGNTIANGADNTATFNAAASAAITASLGTTDRTIGHITVTGVTSSANAISIGGTATLTISTTIPDSLPVFDIAGNPDAGLNLGSGVALAGNQGFEKIGTGVLTLGNANAGLTGDIILTNGVIRSLAPDALNGQNLIVNGASTQWRVDAGEHRSDVILRAGNAVITGGGGAAGSGVANDSTLSGNISEEGATARNVTYYNSVSGADRIKRFIIGGNNSYTGDTTIGNATSASETIVRATHNNAFGTGNSRVTINAGSNHDENVLELSGGITISDKTLVLAGRGQNLTGSLVSMDGHNVWDGAVELGSTDNPRIGVTTGQLTITGEISGNAAGGLIKVGDGVLELSGTNTYTTGTNVIRGTLLISHGQALGSGGVALRNDSTLHINTGIVATVDGLNLVGNDTRLAFSLNGDFTGTSLLVSGDKLGNSNYIVDIFNGGGLTLGTYTLLSVEENWNASGFTLGLLEGGYTGTLNWENGILTLNVIPEPQSLLLIATGLIAVSLSRRLKHLKRS